MKRFLLTAAVNLAASALGLLVASWIIPGFVLRWGGFLLAVVIFTLANTLLAPLVQSMTEKYAPALLGGIGLLTTLVALVVASLFPSGIGLRDLTAWLGGPLVVWLVTSIAGWILLAILRRRGLTPPARSAN